jgi:hypothetical protein
MTSSLAIYLGSSHPTSNDDSSVVVQQVPSLGAAHSDDSSTLSALNIYVNASDLTNAAVWDSPMHLSSFSKQLQPDAVVSIHVLSCEDTTNLQPIHTAFLLAGLLACGERRLDATTRVLSAQTRPQTHKDRSQAAALKTVSVVLEDDYLIDEDDLLNDTSLAPPPAMSLAANAGDDCSGRKACDNCSCGRADEEKKSGDEKPVIQSSDCGKCGLGDAFRCASCPYLGKPAFKAGEEHLVLDLQDDF